MVTESKLTVRARDGFALSCISLVPKDTPKGAVLMAGGTGIKKEYYLNFSRYLCEAGFAVCLFDYRGIGESRPSSLRGFVANNHDWGQKDMPAVLDWMDKEWASVPKYLIGHSAGGQQLGLMDNHTKFSKALLISSSIGYWNWLASPYKYFTLFIWYVIEPVSNTLLGYVPASWFGLGEDLPKGVAREWRSWCLNKNYYGPFLGKTIQPHFFNEVKIPLHFLFPEDDRVVTDRTVAAQRKFYSEAPAVIEKIKLADHGLKKVGHLGFFSRKSREALWGKAVHFLDA